jgi:hypothetical protein
VFVAGKITDHIGLFSQWTYNNLNPTVQPDGNTQFGGHSSVDNNDLRITGHFTKEEIDLLYGLTVNNNPTVQDVWNSTPAFGYHYQVSRLAGVWGIAPPATLIEGGLAQQSAGVSVYALLDKSWYLEFGGYRAADGAFSVFSQGVDIGNRLKGWNPYWRFTNSHDWDEHSISAGIFGLDARLFVDPNDQSTPTDHFRDLGIDMQYRYLSDPHVVTVQANWINEHTDWDTSHLGVDHEGASS